MCAVKVPRSAYGPNLSKAFNLLQRLGIPFVQLELCDSRGTCLFQIAPQHFSLLLDRFTADGIEHKWV